MMNKIIAWLEKKGVWSSALGLYLGFPLCTKFLLDFFSEKEQPEWKLQWFLYGVIASCVYLMLPSLIKITSKLFTVEIKD
jgi:hypothetical protein